MASVYGTATGRIEQYRRDEDDRILRHQRLACYGLWGQCQSCGCSPGKACVSHRGSESYKAELMQQQVELLERIALSLESKT